MDLFAHSGAGSQSTGPAARIERALQDIIAAREAGRIEEAIDRANAALTWHDAALVRRELRAGLARELGFAQMLLGHVQPAREALLMGLEQAAQESALVEPIRAALATLELMGGDAERARAHLDAKTAHRRACLSAQARIELFEGRFPQAEQVLQEGDHAPGGTNAGGVLHPPATVLRCFGAVWSGRPDQARMLYDGVATRDNPVWQLVRVALLRALWVQSGDARYLQLGLAAAEQLRFNDMPTAAPGFAAAAAGMHAACLLLTGDTALAVETAEVALAALREQPLTLPEWPRAAVLFDCAMVFRDAGDEERRKSVLQQWDHLGWASWSARMSTVCGPRAVGVTVLDSEQAVGSAKDGNLEVFAVRLLEDPRNTRLSALRALGGSTRALGVEWLGADGTSLARIGARPREERECESVTLADGGVLRFFRPQRDALRTLDRDTVDAIARVVALREEEARRLEDLADHIARADAARRLAEERLEQVRRPGTDRTHGGRFPTVVGRSETLRACLDRLALVARTRTALLIEGAPGTGRRHLAHAVTGALLDDPTGSVRMPTLDAALVAPESQVGALEALVGRDRFTAGGAWAIVANAEHLGAEAVAWLADRLDRDALDQTRWVLTLDARATSATAAMLRERLAVALVRVPGLDERLEDVPLLTDAFLREIGRRPDELATAARALLARRLFAGHVAELRATVRHAVVRAPVGTIQPEHFESAATEARAGAAFDADEALLLGFQGAVDHFRRALVQKALDATVGNRQRAADLLGLPRARFVKLARELGFDAAEPTGESDDGDTILVDPDESR
jgi:hypothetical protein